MGNDERFVDAVFNDEHAVDTQILVLGLTFSVPNLSMSSTPT